MKGPNTNTGRGRGRRGGATACTRKRYKSIHTLLVYINIIYRICNALEPKGEKRALFPTQEKELSNHVHIRQALMVNKIIL